MKMYVSRPKKAIQQYDNVHGPKGVNDNIYRVLPEKRLRRSEGEKHDKSNVDVTENRQFISFLDQTISTF